MIEITPGFESPFKLYTHFIEYEIPELLSMYPKDKIAKVQELFSARYSEYLSKKSEQPINPSTDTSDNLITIQAEIIHDATLQKMVDICQQEAKRRKL